MFASDRFAEQARSMLDQQVYDYVATGSGVEETLSGNVAAWRDLPLRPRALVDVAAVDTATTLLDTRLSVPVAVAPIGYQRMVHPDGELATAAGASDSLFVLSTRATASFAELSPGADDGDRGPWWFQAYVLRDRDLTEKLVRRAAADGATAVVLTADTPYVGAKARPGAVPFAETALVPELATRSDEGVWQAPDVTAADIGWLRDISGGLPVVVKGVLRADDARACLDAGASAVWVSNHGGRQLDGAVPTAVALREVAAAVGDAVEVYVDGGVRTGRDVLRAVALGARAVFLGRPVIWALAGGGAEGVRTLLDAIGGEFREAMRLAGCRSLAEVTGDLLCHRP